MLCSFSLDKKYSEILSHHKTKHYCVELNTGKNKISVVVSHIARLHALSLFWKVTADDDNIPRVRSILTAKKTHKYVNYHCSRKIDSIRYLKYLTHLPFEESNKIQFITVSPSYVPNCSSYQNLLIKEYRTLCSFP